MLRLRALLLLLLCTSVLADERVVVNQIEIRGAKATRRWVIERELYFSVGDTITASDLDAAHKRLHNLLVFNDAELTVDSSGTVVVELSEAWPILPVVSINFTEGDATDALRNPSTVFENVSVLAGVRHINLRGNAEDLFAFAQLGSANGFYVGYSTRWLSPESPYAVKARVQYLTVSDRHASVLDSSRDLKDDAISLEAGTRGGGHRRLGLGLSYQYIEQEKTWPAEGGIYRTLWISPYAGLDYRDLEWWPSRGAFAQTRVNLANGTKDFVRAQYSLASYFPLRSYFSREVLHRPPVLAFQVSGATSSESTPSWAHYYFGFESSFRGYHGVQTESSGFLVGETELRFPITIETTYDVPIIGRWGKRWPLGLAGVLFAQGGELQLGDSYTTIFGYGVGLYVRVPYVQVVELAGARNRDGQNEVSLNLGVAF